ncbi:MAG: hypothetical protein P9X27_06660 [Candidatus Kaelpia aquatica]|nr:hypothetical protein [Candidatus Kaelpia aquatica]
MTPLSILLLNPASFLNRVNNSRVFYVFDADAVLEFELAELDLSFAGG